MPNPFFVANQGKGFLPMLARGQAIANRYGFTPRKMENAIAAWMNVLSRSACCATMPVTASTLASNPTISKKHSLQRVELAIHGLHHLDYSLLCLEQQLDHLRQAQSIFQRLGIAATGFRCPYLRWNQDTLTALQGTGFTYDSSQAMVWDVANDLSTDAYKRVLDFYRAQPVNSYPALPHWSDGLIRIPYSLPDDEALVDRIHLLDPTAMAEIWLEMMDCAYQGGELFTLGLHPERIHLCQAALQVVLERARTLSPGVWIARLDEIAAWYLALGKSTFEIHQESGDVYQ
ncbi:MAG: polysaccharide deacetylase family protein, partial [Anaerolineaceae bacterium]|nr:polysaccharide deacetylase family protein [Anaerolineaceae bacterium]